MSESYNYFEIAGIALGIICVILVTIEHIWCWPTGILSTLLLIYHYYQLTLYINVLLHIFFLVACIIGWYQWLYGGENKSTLKLSRINKKQIWIFSIVTIALTFILGIVFDKFSNDKRPYLDALLSSLSITAQWMMNIKLIESWFVWIVADIMYSVMFYQSKEYPYLLLYVSYVIFAVLGYYLWVKSLKKEALLK